MQKRLVKTGVFRKSLAMLAVLSMFAACSGLLQNTDNDETAQEAKAIEKHGAVIRIPLTASSASRLVLGSDNVGLSLTDARDTADYFEAYLKDGSTPAQTYFGSAQAGVDYLIIGVVPGSYNILVLAGTGANGNPATGEKVLLGVGASPAAVNAVAGKVTTAIIPMKALSFQIEVKGVKKDWGTVIPTAMQPIDVNYDPPKENTLFYAQFAKRENTPPDPWGSVDMSVAVKIENLGAIGDWMTSPPLYPTNNVKARIRTFSTTGFAMGPLVFNNQGTMPAIASGAADTDFTFTLLKTNIPTWDAAGAFFFNVILPDPKDATGATPSQWNIRNRLLYSAGGYYGGGIAFLFGNAGTTWVRVIPDPWS